MKYKIVLEHGEHDILLPWLFQNVAYLERTEYSEQSEHHNTSYYGVRDAWQVDLVDIIAADYTADEEIQITFAEQADALMCKLIFGGTLIAIEESISNE